MAQYIDKSALVAEIKNRRDSFYSLSESCEKGTPARAGFYAQAQTLEGILSFLDNLEVKEIGIDDSNIDDLLEEDGIDPTSKEARIFKECYCSALEKLKEKKGE